MTPFPESSPRRRRWLHNEIAPAEMARMRAQVKPVQDKYAASYEPAVVTVFVSEFECVSKF